MKRLLLVIMILAAAVPATAVFRVISIDGRLSAAGKELKVGAVIPDGTKVELADGTATLATAEARFLLRGPAVLIPRKSSVTLSLGGLLSVLRGKVKSFSVRTPTSVAAVRGTDFYVEARGDSESYVCICRGTLETSAEGVTPKPISAEHHAAVRFVKKGSRTRRLPASFEAHTDAELEDLRRALGP